MSNPLPVSLTPRAIRQLGAASNWWSRNRPDAPGMLQVEVQRAFTLISGQPQIGVLFLNPRIKGVRRIHLSGIRYSLYYRVTGSGIQVLALWHSSRGSDPF